MRLVACGYTQIPGIDFTENFAPVISDIGYKILLTLMIINNWKGWLVDVETAFLNGELEEDIYMEIPQGHVEHGRDKILQLLCWAKSQSN